MPLKTSSSTYELSADRLKQNFSDILPTTRKTFTQKRPYASQAMCPRQMTLAGLCPSGTDEIGKSLPFYGAIGSAIEDVAVSAYAEAGQLITSDWKIPTDFFGGMFDIGGKIDLIISMDGEPILLDIKTTGSVLSTKIVKLSDNDLGDLKSGESLTIEPDDDRILVQSSKATYPNYIAQMQVYSAVTGIRTAYLQYFSRKVQDIYSHTDTSPTTDFVKIDTSDDSLARRIAMVIYAIDCRNRGLIPAIPEQVKKTHCSNAFCRFQNYCWGNSVLPISENLIEENLARVLKKDAFDKAKLYIAGMPERLEKFMKLAPQLIQNEKQKRQFSRN